MRVVRVAGDAEARPGDSIGGTRSVPASQSQRVHAEVDQMR
jgi:hypothetical protein